MATERYSTYVGDQDPAVTISTGAATVQGNIELTVDFGTVVSDGGSGRKPTREEVIQGIERILRYIISNQFPTI